MIGTIGVMFTTILTVVRAAVDILARSVQDAAAMALIAPPAAPRTDREQR